MLGSCWIILFSISRLWRTQPPQLRAGAIEVKAVSFSRKRVRIETTLNLPTGDRVTEKGKILLGIAVLLAALNLALWASHSRTAPSGLNLSHIQTRADAGDSDAQLQLYFAFKNGELGLTADPKAAITWLRKAAEHGSPKAQNLLGIAYEKGADIEQSEEEALVWYTRAASGGNADAQGNVGRMHHLGKGTPQDYKKAAEWYEKAAVNGQSEAQHNLGNLYLHGEGVEKNNAEAFKWFSKAADESNFGPSQANLARMYFQGRGIEKNYVKAGEYYRLALTNGVEDTRPFIESSRARCLGNSKNVSETVVADCLVSAGAGDAEAQFTIGTLYDSGTYLRQSREEALRWYEKAAFQNEPKAQGMLIVRYDDGTLDGLIKSYAWLSVLQANESAREDPATLKLVSTLPDIKSTYESKLSAADVKLAKAMAEQYAEQIHKRK